MRLISGKFTKFHWCVVCNSDWVRVARTSTNYQEILVLCNLRVHFRAHNSRQWSQPSPLHCSSRSIFPATSHLHTGLPRGFFPTISQTKILYAFWERLCRLRATVIVHARTHCHSTQRTRNIMKRKGYQCKTVQAFLAASEDLLQSKADSNHHRIC